MAPISAFLAVILLTLSSVDAKRKDKVVYSQYFREDCNGHPLKGEIYDLKLDKDKKSKCVSAQAGGVRFHKHHKDKYNQWINDVNSGKDECGATMYKGFGCLAENAVSHISLPAGFTKCSPLSDGVSSIEFWCQPNYGYNGVAVPREVELAVTSYSIANDGKAHPSVYTTVFNATQHLYQSFETVTELEHVTVTARELNPRAEPTHKAPLEPRKKKSNEKGVWMKHPWTGSDLCFKCWTKKEMEFGKFYCRSGHGDKYAIDCGPKPTPVPLTSTDLTTSTHCIEFFHTTTDQFSHTPHPTTVPEKRSPHKAVVFQHPYIPSKRICADAEWENSGKDKAEVRIQKIRALEKCEKKNALNIDIGIPEHTQYSVITTTASITHSTHPSWAFPQPTTTDAPVY